MHVLHSIYILALKSALLAAKSTTNSLYPSSRRWVSNRVSTAYKLKDSFEHIHTDIYEYICVYFVNFDCRVI